MEKPKLSEQTEKELQQLNDFYINDFAEHFKKHFTPIAFLIPYLIGIATGITLSILF